MQSNITQLINSCKANWPWAKLDQPCLDCHCCETLQATAGQRQMARTTNATTTTNIDLKQGTTSLNKNPSWSWSFLAPIIIPELELEFLGYNICYQSWSWSFWALKFFIELELELTSSRLLFWS